MAQHSRGANMNKICWLAVGLSVVAGGWMLQAAGDKIDTAHLLVRQAAFIDYRSMKPGTFRKITTADLPKPFATDSARNAPRLVPRPAEGWPQAAPGFMVDLYASGLDGPRQIRIATNGQVPVA